jgi:hypothetical protein
LFLFHPSPLAEDPNQPSSCTPVSVIDSVKLVRYKNEKLKAVG